MPVRTDLGPRSLYLAGSHVSNRCSGSITWSSTLVMRGRSATECPRLPQRLDLNLVILQDVCQHDVVVLSDGRRLLRQRQLVADQLDRRRQLVAAEALLGDPLEAVLELRVV